MTKKLQSAAEYRAKARERMKKFYEKQKEKGIKRITAMISNEAYELIKSSDMSKNEIIDKAILKYFEQHPKDMIPTIPAKPKKKISSKNDLENE